GPENINFLPLQENIFGERVFIIAPYHKEPSPHILQHLLPMKYNFYGIRGLYVESSKHARFIFDLENELEPNDSIIWGNYLDRGFISEDLNIIEQILPYQFSVLGINYVIAFKNYSSSWQKLQEIAKVPGLHNNQTNSERNNFSYYLYKIGNTSLVEVLKYHPKFVKENWQKESVRWFLSDSIKQGVLTNEQTPSFVGTGKEKIEIEQISKRQDHLKFKVINASNPVPILVKISFFPNWKAYEFLGNEKKEIKIYRASPEIMLLYANGEVEMRYEKIWCDKFGEILSLIGLLVVLFCIAGIISEKLNIGFSFLRNGLHRIC
ncbi:MAG: hypothetical protein N3A69_13740, partial [Leptospiraceae bacterium]|nr:hypothetical protein [Leptospiraceae bacterium]